MYAYHLTSRNEPGQSNTTRLRRMKMDIPVQVITTSGLLFAGPLVTVPSFFMSMVQTPSLPSAFLACNSKIPLTYNIVLLACQTDEQGARQTNLLDLISLSLLVLLEYTSDIRKKVGELNKRCSISSPTSPTQATKNEP